MHVGRGCAPAVVVERGSPGAAGATRRMLGRFPSFRLTVATPDTLLFERVSTLEGPAAGGRSGARGQPPARSSEPAR